MGLVQSLLALENHGRFKKGFNRAIDICLKGGNTEELRQERIRHIEKFGTDKERYLSYGIIAGALTDHFESVLSTWKRKAAKKGCDPETFEKVAQFCFENGMFEWIEKEMADARRFFGRGPKPKS